MLTTTGTVLVGSTNTVGAGDNGITGAACGGGATGTTGATAEGTTSRLKVLSKYCELADVTTGLFVNGVTDPVRGKGATPTPELFTKPHISVNNKT